MAILNKAYGLKKKKDILFSISKSTGYFSSSGHLFTKRHPQCPVRPSVRPHSQSQELGAPGKVSRSHYRPLGSLAPPLSQASHSLLRPRGSGMFPRRLSCEPNRPWGTLCRESAQRRGFQTFIIVGLFSSPGGSKPQKWKRTSGVGVAGKFFT